MSFSFICILHYAPMCFGATRLIDYLKIYSIAVELRNSISEMRNENFLSKLVPSFSRNETPPPTDHDDAGPGPDSNKYNLYECRVCGKTIKLTTRDGKQKAVKHTLSHGNMFYYNCRVHGCVAKYRKCHQIKYHHRKFHNSKKKSSPDSEFLNDAALILLEKMKSSKPVAGFRVWLFVTLFMFQYTNYYSESSVFHLH
ncbi:hypothetical protein CAEBREN_17759 [Caenorhabditis brenneri]|uniref:C2H2-type domain-containing protein n=1 Tax=Caenorhabditis brenneri TaxID=135651 RepID=G0PDU7_CAEBE|nr:hypothetical protein CAEBREN_17759 [Caenorhabditis brenneri]